MSEKTISEHYRGAVLYTDGSARPNPGNMGWGAHGYIYTTEPSTKGTGLQKYVPTLKGYVHASHKDRVQSSIVTPVQYIDFFGAKPGIGTNNVAEVDALYHSLEKLQDHDLVQFQIFTDSEYLRRGLEEWVDTWKRNGWKRSDGTDVPNSENWVRLLDLIDRLKADGKDVKIEWVKGHSDVFGNINADRLATIGVLYSMRGVAKEEYNISESQGYWKSDVDRHPLLCFKRLYFNSDSQYNEVGRYYTAEPGGDDHLIGNRMPEAAYSVVHLYEPESVIEMMKQKQFEVSNGINAVIMMLLDRVFTDDVYPLLKDHGGYSILPNTRPTFGMDFIDKKPITIERNPAGLSLRAIESFSLLDELLECYDSIQRGEACTTGRCVGMAVHPITDIFYELKESTSVLKPEFVVGFRNITVSVTVEHKGKPRTIDVPLILRKDLPPRNTLKRIETESPKVNLITWRESEGSVRYATVIETKSGKGIWSNLYADRILL